MQLKTPVKIALFSYTEIFLIAFCILFYFNLFSCLLLHIKVFLKNLQKAIFSWKKFENPKKGKNYVFRW